VRPGDAVNAVYRGRQLIVAGDDQQLPPTSFFDVVTGRDDDEYDEDEPEEFESILGLALGSAALPELPLRWHYRSRDESLITFSNREIYGGRLVTFPGAVDRGDDVGIELFRVDGVYDRGGRRTNPIEADAVVARVLHHATHHPDRTLGVVAFSEAQAAEIERRLDRARAGRPDLDAYFADDRLDGFFVRNLENVQGDERDTIVFSVGYGPDEQGRVTMHFGPLNGPNGHRRLNVAVTRARRRVEVLTSLTAEQIPRGVAARGVQLLRRYLEDAGRGAAPAAATDGPRPDLEADVAAVLRARGYDVATDVGQLGHRIGVAVRDPARPGRFAIGVETDGARYDESKVARDRDRLRHEVLTGLGWRLHRVWARSWYRNRTTEIARLCDAVDAALRDEPAPGGGVGAAGADGSADVTVAAPAAAGAAARAGSAGAADAADTGDEPVIEIVDLDATPDWTEVYEVATVVADRRTAIDAPTSRTVMGRLIVGLVRVEGPISDALVTRRLCDAWGVPTTAKARSAVLAVLTQSIRRGSLERPEPGFVVLAGRAGRVPVRVPDEDDERTARSVDDVASCELEEAMLRMVEDARAVDEDELQLRVARLFGWSRRGSDIAARLDAALGHLVARNEVVRTDRWIRPVAD
jgi:hypothetical protein